MMPTPIALLKKAAELDLKLGQEGRGTLTVEPAERCPPAFADTLKDHKWPLLDLLRLPFVMVFSQSLEETIFFCADEDTRNVLIEAGAERWSIYTRSELQILCEQKRIDPLTQAELAKLYEIKRTLRGTITEP